MRIKRFNEAVENKPFTEGRFKKIDGEVWISKSDLIESFKTLIDVMTLENLKVNKDEKFLVTNGVMLEQLVTLMKSLKTTIGKIGREKNPGDPYDEEDWDD